ncbi:MAG: hypothetical protein WCO84_08080 [bacterium]
MDDLAEFLDLAGTEASSDTGKDCGLCGEPILRDEPWLYVFEGAAEWLFRSVRSDAEPFIAHESCIRRGLQKDIFGDVDFHIGKLKAASKEALFGPLEFGHECVDCGAFIEEPIWFCYNIWGVEYDRPVCAECKGDREEED